MASSASASVTARVRAYDSRGRRRSGPPMLPAWFHEPDPSEHHAPRMRFRTVWISDVHLGTRGCNAELLSDFLKSIECEMLYLVGDIVDGWRLKRGWYWPPAHNDVIRRILKMAKTGTQVIYVPGNHDEAFRDYTGLHFGDVELAAEAVHHTADGRRLLVVHGDIFDGVVLYARWLALLGDHAYELLLKANVLFNRCRRRLGLPYWSLSAYLKRKVKNAVEYVCRFEEAVAHAAVERGVDGIVCGHIHSAEIRSFGDVVYYNDGDWVESCTALVEDEKGEISILDWMAHRRRDRESVRHAQRVDA